MPPKKKAAVAPPPVDEPVDEVQVLDPLKGTDYFRYANGTGGGGVTYEGGYDSYQPPPPVSAEPVGEADPKAKKGKDDKKGKKGKEESQTPAESTDPPKLVRQGLGTYDDGKIHFRGHWEIDVIHGEGTMKYPSGAIYEGEWNQGKYSGQGKYTWPDGSWYEGGWREDKVHGNGKYFDQSREKTFNGQYYNGNGPGLYGQE